MVILRLGIQALVSRLRFLLTYALRTTLGCLGSFSILMSVWAVATFEFVRVVQADSSHLSYDSYVRRHVPYKHLSHFYQHNYFLSEPLAWCIYFMDMA